MTAWLTLLLIVLRVVGFIVVAPFFSRKEIPVLAKVAIAWTLAILIFPGLEDDDLVSGNYILLAVSESLYGLALGFSANLLFFSFQGSGHLMEQQAGFGMASWFDPSMGQTSVLSKLMSIFGIMIFLVMDGHHILIIAAISGFRMVPPGLNFIGGGIVEVLLNAFVSGFIFILRFAAPVMVVIFITDILLGLLGKTVPQLNVLMMGLPVKAMVSMLILLSILPAYINLSEPLIKDMMTILFQILGSAP